MAGEGLLYSTGGEKVRSGGSDGKEGKQSHSAGDPGLIPGSGLFPGEGSCYLLVWRIPWIEEPGRLQSMGLQGVGHH